MRHRRKQRDFIDDMVDDVSLPLAPSSGISRAIAPKTALSSVLSPTALRAAIGKTPLSPATIAQVKAPAASTATPAQTVVISTPDSHPSVETPPVGAVVVNQAPGDLMRQVLGQTLAQRLQSQATSENRRLMNEHDFRRSVIARLSRIESRLPAASTLAQQIRTVRVLLG